MRRRASRIEYPLPRLQGAAEQSVTADVTRLAFLLGLEPTGFEPATFSLEGLVRPQTSPGEP